MISGLCAFENNERGSFISSITTPHTTVQLWLEPFKQILTVCSPWLANVVAEVRSKSMFISSVFMILDA